MSIRTPSGSIYARLSELDAFTGLGPASLANLQRRGLCNQSGPVRIADLLRERADGTIALVPTVRRQLSNRYVDRFLDNVLALLDAPASDLWRRMPSSQWSSRRARYAKPLRKGCRP